MRANTCLVVDVWEGQLEVNEAVLKQNGVAGMGIRLNDMNGGHHLDTNFWKQWGEARNFVRFPYFVYNPWVDGAANFAWLAANCPTEALTVAVDVEVRKPGYAPATFARELDEFLGLCAARWKVIIYTAQWFLPYLGWWPHVDYWWAQYPDQDHYFGGVSTWADLKKRLDQLDKPFNVESIPGQLRMWQFSGDYLKLPGFSTAADVNIFYGTVQDLAEYFGTGSVIKPVQGSGLYTFSDVNYYSRGKGPLTLAMSRQRKLGDNLVNLNWKQLKPVLQKLNASNKAAVDQIVREDWGPTKGRDGDTVRWIGLLWPGRNIVKIEETTEGPYDSPGTWGRVNGIAVEKAGILNVDNNPDLVHMVYDYHSRGGWAPRKKPVYVPILNGPWWVEMNKLVSVDSLLPKIVKITAFPRLNLRGGPGTDAAMIGYKYFGDTVIVDQVKIGKGGIWGKIPDGWIGLRASGTNWTDWKV